MISKLSKEGAYRKALEVFYTLAEMDIAVDTAVVNAAISATDRGEIVPPLPMSNPGSPARYGSICICSRAELAYPNCVFPTLNVSCCLPRQLVSACLRFVSCAPGQNRKPSP